MKDFGKSQRDYAIYLPAISSFYVSQLRKVTEEGNDARVPAGFELGNEGLNFLNDENSYYHYPWGLYSAGHAQLDLAKADKDDAMVQQRDRNKTVILGDSGGFQVATGVIKMDWSNALDPNDPSRLALCEKILRWLEKTADWSMILDVPSSAAAGYSHKTGLTNFQSTIDITVLNIDYFMKNRVPGATKFLNILSGNDEDGSDLWYESVINFSKPDWVEEHYGNRDLALEGYAFAGNNKSNMYLALKRIVDLASTGMLEGKDWIHFLGTGKLNWACFLTSIQRNLRKHYNPNITLSFDAASPFVNTAYGQCYSYNYFSPKRFGYFMDKAIDNQALKGSDMPMPFNGPIMERLTAGDICIHGAGDLDKNGKPKEKGATSWDTQSYLYYMAHSVHNHINAVQEANRLADIERFRNKQGTKPHYSQWIRDKKNKGTNEISPYAPYTVLLFDSFVEELLDPKCKDPYAMLQEYRAFLDEMSFGGADSEKVTNLFFEDSEDTENEDHENFEDIIKDI